MNEKAIKLLQKWSVEDAFAAGLKEGARRERMRLRKLAVKYPDASLYILLTGATKTSRKRKGGK